MHRIDLIFTPGSFGCDARRHLRSRRPRYLLFLLPFWLNPYGTLPPSKAPRQLLGEEDRRWDTDYVGSFDANIDKVADEGKDQWHSKWQPIAGQFSICFCGFPCASIRESTYLFALWLELWSGRAKHSGEIAAPCPTLRTLQRDTFREDSQSTAFGCCLLGLGEA